MGDFLQVDIPRIGPAAFPTGTKAADIQSVDEVGAGLQILSKEFQDIFQKRSDYFAEKWKAGSIIELQNKYNSYFQKNISKIEAGGQFPMEVSSLLKEDIQRIADQAPTIEHAASFINQSKEYGRSVITKAFDAQVAADKFKEDYDLKVFGELSKSNIFENPTSSIFNSNFGAIKAMVDSNTHLSKPEQFDLLFEYQLDASKTLVQSWVDRTSDTSIEAFDAWVAKTRKESPDFLGTADFMYWAHNQINANNKAKAAAAADGYKARADLNIYEWDKGLAGNAKTPILLPELDDMEDGKRTENINYTHSKQAESTLNQVQLGVLGLSTAQLDDLKKIKNSGSSAIDKNIVETIRKYLPKLNEYSLKHYGRKAYATELNIISLILAESGGNWSGMREEIDQDTGKITYITGYTQVSLATAIGAGFTREQVLDKEQNVYIGMFLMNKFLHEYNGDMNQSYVGYHSGTGHVKDYLEGGWYGKGIGPNMRMHIAKVSVHMLKLNGNHDIFDKLDLAIQADPADAAEKKMRLQGAAGRPDSIFEAHGRGRGKATVNYLYGRVPVLKELGYGAGNLLTSNEVAIFKTAPIKESVAMMQEITDIAPALALQMRGALLLKSKALSGKEEGNILSGIAFGPYINNKKYPNMVEHISGDLSEKDRELASKAIAQSASYNVFRASFRRSTGDPHMAQALENTIVRAAHGSAKADTAAHTESQAKLDNGEALLDRVETTVDHNYAVISCGDGEAGDTMIHIPQKFVKGKFPLEKLERVLGTVKDSELTTIRGTKIKGLDKRYETVFVTTPDEQGMALAYFMGSSKYKIILNVNGGYVNYIPFDKLPQWIAGNLKRDANRDKPFLETAIEAFSSISLNPF